MIKETKIKEMKEVERVTKREYFCDKCGLKIERESFSRDNFKFVFMEGDVFPEGGTVDIEEAYFCRECGEDIKKRLLSIGVSFTFRSLDI